MNLQKDKTRRNKKKINYKKQTSVKKKQKKYRKYFNIYLCCFAKKGNNVCEKNVIAFS